MSGLLDPTEERRFQDWIRGTGWYQEFKREYGEEPDLNAPEYDYRAAWRAGVQPERDPYDNNRYHWPSSDPSGRMLKSEDHPTAWKEHFMRATGQNPDALGLTRDQAEQYMRQPVGMGLLDFTPVGLGAGGGLLMSDDAYAR